MPRSNVAEPRWMRLVGGRLVGVVACLVAATHVLGGQAPRTADGQPDLRGVWNYGTETPLQRPDEFAGKATLTPAEAAAYTERQAQRRRERESRPNRYSGEVFDDVLAKADWTKRTSLIVDPPDGKIPPITPQAAARRERRAALFARPDGPEDTGLADRCVLGWGTGPPIIPGNQSNVVQLFQSRDHVVVYTEMIHDARIVPLSAPPPVGYPIHEYAGISSGHWEKDTLVVQTANFTKHGVATLTFNRSGGTDENMELEERFTRTGPDTLLYEFTIADPTTWTRPWRASMTMQKTDERVFEYACHEGNHSLTTMLENARAADAAEKSVAAPARPPK